MSNIFLSSIADSFYPTDSCLSDVSEKKFDNQNISHSIIYEFTKNPEFLKQYYELREDCYREDLGLKFFSGAEEEHDRLGHIIIARKGNKVIAGSRLTICTPKSNMNLPLEDKDFLVTNLFPELSLVNKNYCEISRFVIVPDFRNGELNQEFLRIMVEKAELHGCQYQFSVAPLAQARNSRKIFNKINRSHVIQTSIIVPYKHVYECNNQKMCISITHLVPNLSE